MVTLRAFSRLDVLLGMVGTWFGFSSCITGFYGMNLPYGAYTGYCPEP
jgi:Mg2+ and Co2+ transporter CorA